MSSVAIAPATTVVGRRAINSWAIAGVVVVPAFMEMLDTTLNIVSLRYIAGGLSAAQTDAQWIVTAYLAANAVVLPITGWLSSYLGRRNYFLLSIAVFTLASALCGMATSLGQIILFRVIQGLAGGGLQPPSQAILMDSFPAEKQGAAMTLFAVTAILGPIVGPTLGGWICVNYDWRLIYFVNVGIGLLVLMAAYPLVADPDYLKRERTELRSRPLNFDSIGLGLLVLVMSTWQVILSKGQEWDWLGDPFGRVQTLATLFVLGLGFLIVRELRTANPIINFRVLGERNLAVSCVIMCGAFAVVYAAFVILSTMLQALLGYDAFRAGLVMSPGGISAMAAMVIGGILMGRGADARWLVAAGLLVVAAATYWMSQLNLQISPTQVVWPFMLLFAGVGLFFGPLNLAAYKYTPATLRGAAVGLLSLLRSEGGSIGTSVAQTAVERREQFHLSRLTDGLSTLNEDVQWFLEGARKTFLSATGDSAQSQQMSVQVLDDLRQQQAVSLAFFDVFFLCAVVSASLVVLVLFMKRSVAEKTPTSQGSGD